MHNNYLKHTVNCVKMWYKTSTDSSAGHYDAKPWDSNYNKLRRFSHLQWQKKKRKKDLFLIQGIFVHSENYYQNVLPDKEEESGSSSISFMSKALCSTTGSKTNKMYTVIKKGVSSISFMSKALITTANWPVCGQGGLCRCNLWQEEVLPLLYILHDFSGCLCLCLIEVLVIRDRGVLLLLYLLLCLHCCVTIPLSNVELSSKL